MGVEEGALYGRLLVSRPGFYRRFTNGPWSLWIYDGSSLPYLVEEFVAHAAVEVAVPARSLAATALDGVSPILRERIRVVDRDHSIYKSVDSILAPLYDEFAVVVDWDGVIARQHGAEQTPAELVKAITTVREQLYDFLLGALLRLQVALDFNGMKRATQGLRRVARGSDTRAVLAVLAGVFETYRETTMDAVILLPAATEDQAYRFRAFVEDETYRQMSLAAGSFGLPNKLSRSLLLLRRYIRSLAEKSAYKHLFSVASKSVSVAAELALPEDGLLDAIIPRGYLPPLIETREMYHRARTTWLSMPRKSLNDELVSAGLNDKDREFFLTFGKSWEEVEGGSSPKVPFGESRIIMSSDKGSIALTNPNG